MKVERHPLGPRLYVLGARVHEAVAGIALLLAALVLSVTRLGLPVHLTSAAWVVGTWMLAKDWRDLVPRWRNTAAWSLGLHRPHAPLRTTRRAMWLPGATATLVGLAGLGQLLRAIDAGAGQRLGLSGLVGLFGFSVPLGVAATVGVGLMGLAVAIEDRRRPAWGLLVALAGGGALGAAASGRHAAHVAAAGALAALLVWGREAFWVRGDLGELRRALRLAPAVLAGALGLALLTVMAAGRGATSDIGPASALREAAHMIVLTPGPLTFDDHLGLLPIAAGVLGALGLVALASRALRPAPPPPRNGCERSFAHAERIVRTHGHDTLSFFKLRRDAHKLFGPGGLSMLAYRVEAGVMLLSADPVGPAAELPGLVRHAAAEAEAHGLRLGVVGARASMLSLYRDAGLRAFYLGDEAIVEVATFSLEGRAIRKVRQSVTRLVRLGYTAELRPLGELGARDLAELDAVSARWRGDAPERGFSMATDLLGGDHQADSLVLTARDAHGAVRGFLHFVPCFGRPALSLGMMRRDRDTPNGLMEYLIATGIGMLAERGVEELSLNFATCGRWMRCPSSRTEALLGRLVGRLDRWFQVERLLAFNAKFSPRWEPRYLCYEGPLGLPRAGLAALRAEGLLPRAGGRPEPAADVLTDPVRGMTPS